MADFFKKKGMEELVKVLTDEMYNINLDFERDVDWGIFEKITVGGRYTDRTKENDQINDWERLAKQDHGLTDYGMSYSIGGGYNVPNIYSFKNWTEVANVAFGGFTNPGDRSDKNELASWKLNETNTAAYVMLNMSGEIGDIPFTGNVGLRYAKTEVESTGHEQTNGGGTDPIAIDHDYDEFLPSLNMVFNITDDSQIRLASNVRNWVNDLNSNPDSGNINLVYMNENDQKSNPIDLESNVADQLPSAALDHVCAGVGSR